MTAQEVIDLARVPLNDADKDRYPDAVLLRFLIAGLRLLQRTRADLFIGSLAVTQPDLGFADELPTPAHVDQSLADYVTARAMTVDTEDGERAGAFFQLAGGQL
ncbi:MAG: hypothetical protein V4614_14900 [Pseudomonadota bacterium]